MVSPKPVSLTQVDAEDYDGAFEPQPLVVVGPIPGGGGGGGAVNSVNGKTGTVVLNAADVVAVPPTRTVAGKPLSSNVTLAVVDIEGLETSLAGLAPYTALNAVGNATVAAQATADEALGKANTAVQPAALASYVPTSRTVAGKALTADVTLAKGDVGLGNVDNTSDANKPVSTATTTQLNLKAPLASPAFTGTPTGITKAHVGLGNVDNTSDANKPVSTATQTALNLKANAADFTPAGLNVWGTAPVVFIESGGTIPTLPGGGLPDYGIVIEEA